MVLVNPYTSYIGDMLKILKVYKHYKIFIIDGVNYTNIEIVRFKIISLKHNG